MTGIRDGERGKIANSRERKRLPRLLRALLVVAFLASLTGVAGAYSIENPSGGSGHTSLVLDSAGNPVIAYVSGYDLKVLHCDDPNCAGTETPTSPDTIGNFGGYTSLVLDSAGNPVISYYDWTNGDLKVLHCDDPNCAGTETPTSPDTAGNVGQYTSLALDSAGNPVISYYDRTNGDLKVLHCDDPNCAGTETPTSPDTFADVGRHSSLALDSVGNPVISYYYVSGQNLKVLHCDDPNCAGTETPASPDTAGNVGKHTALVLDGAGNPVITYIFSHSFGSNFRVLHCDDPNCVGTETPEPGESTNGQMSLVLDSSGNPVISYDLGSVLGVLHCDDPNCAGIETPTRHDDEALGSALTRYSSIALDSAGNPVVSYIETNTGQLRVLHCSDPNCTPPPSCNGLLVTVDLNDPANTGPTPRDDVILGTPGADVINAKAGNDTVCAGDGDDQVYGLDGDDWINGGPGNDVITGNNGVDTLFGDMGADTVNGGPDNDYLYGGDGDDEVFGQGGDDYILGGPGNDVIIGVSGLDTIYGGQGDDTLNGGPDRDFIFGGDGADVIFGLTGDDDLFGDAGNDTIFGQPGVDTINGGADDDLIWGNEGNDSISDPSGTNTINGGSGDDDLTGGTGADQIYGDGDLTQGGNDVIDGGPGSDLLIGFNGNDTITANDGEPDTVNAGPNLGDICVTDPIDTDYNCA